MQEKLLKAHYNKNNAVNVVPKLCTTVLRINSSKIKMSDFISKVKDIIDMVCMLHSLDRMELAREVDRRARQHGRVIPALVQVNIAGEEQKGGIMPEDVDKFNNILI